MNGVVTNRQIFFILLLTVTMDSFIHIPKEAVKASGTGAWFSIAILTVIFATGAYIFSSLNKKFSGKTTFQYSKILIGKFGSYIVTSIYVAYFFIALITITQDVSFFINGTFLKNTPIWALVLLGLLMGAYISSKGITNIGRMCEIYGVVLIVVAFSAHAAMFFLGDIRNIQPFFDARQLKGYVIGAKDLIFPFLGIEIFTILPFDKARNKKATLYSVISILFVGIFYIVVIETSTMIIGPRDILMYSNSLIEALRETKLPKAFVLERADLLFLTVGIAGIIGGYCTVFCAIADNAIKLIPKINRNLVLIIIAAVAFFICVFFVNEQIEKILVNSIISALGIITSFVIPIVLFIISKVRKV